MAMVFPEVTFQVFSLFKETIPLLYTWESSSKISYSIYLVLCKSIRVCLLYDGIYDKVHNGGEKLE